MSLANPLWGTSRIHGELLKLGIEIGQTSVARYMARRSGPPRRMEDVPSQPCGCHCRNGPLRRADNLVPIALRLLIMGHGRGQILWFGVTAHPTAEWIANQLTEALWLGANPSLLDQGPRSSLWRDLCPPGSVDRHSRPPDVFPLTLAKRPRRTVDRFNPKGMH